MLTLTLQKMNLELLRCPDDHHGAWWPRLFRSHAEIAFDDDSKDYSDLPAPILQRRGLFRFFSLTPAWPGGIMGLSAVRTASAASGCSGAAAAGAPAHGPTSASRDAYISCMHNLHM